MVNLRSVSRSLASHSLASRSLALLAVALPTPAPAQGSGNSFDNLADWHWSGVSQGIGASGMHVSAAGGFVEVIVGSGSQGYGWNRFWAIERYDPVTGGYLRKFTSTLYPEAAGPRAFHVADVRVEAGPEILVGRGDGTVEIWNQATRTLLHSFGAGRGITTLATADLDGDGNVEVVVCTPTSMDVLDLQGVALWSLPIGASKLAIAQMDADPALEVALGSGDVVDGVSRQVQWSWAAAPFVQLAAVDLDGDGMAELVTSDILNPIEAFDVDSGSSKWILPAPDFVSAMAVTNLDGDPAPEIIVGQDRRVRIYDTGRLALQSERGLFATETLAVAAGDVDGDGGIEVVLASGYDRSFRALWVMAPGVQTFEWESPDLHGPFGGPVFGDLDGDGRIEMVVTATGEGVANQLHLLVFDGVTRELLTVEVAGRPTTSLPLAVTLVDTDGDSVPEIVTATASIDAWNFSRTTGVTNLWSVVPGSWSGTAVAAQDVDGDGVPDLVVGTRQGVDIWDLATRQLVWRSFSLGVCRELDLHDASADGNPDIVVRGPTGTVYVFDGVTRQALAAIQSSVGSRATTVAGWAGTPALAIGDESGALTAWLLQGSGPTALGPIPISARAIDGLLTLPASPLSLNAVDGVLRIHDGFPVVWTSARYGIDFGRDIVLHPTQPAVFTSSAHSVFGFFPIL